MVYLKLLKNIMKKLLLMSIVSCSVLMTGCKSAADLKAIDEKISSPPITKLGNFDGCEVVFVDRHYASQSFFMAKCPGNSTTLTNNYTEQVGKTSQNRTRTSIVQEIEGLKKELAVNEVKEQAMKKLSLEEIKALNLKN